MRRARASAKVAEAGESVPTSMIASMLADADIDPAIAAIFKAQDVRYRADREARRKKLVGGRTDDGRELRRANRGNGAREIIEA